MTYTAPDGLHSLTAFDDLGRAVRTVNPDGTTASVLYDGLETVGVDGNGHLSISRSDVWGQLVEVDEPLAEVQDTFLTLDDDLWTFSGHQSIENGTIKTVGPSGWSGTFYRDVESVTEDEGTFVVFKVDSTSALAAWGLETVPGYPDPTYLRWSLRVEGGKLRAFWCEGATCDWVDLMDVRADTWYGLLLRVDQDGHGRLQVWERSDPGVSASYVSEDAIFGGRDYRFRQWTHTGTSWMHRYDELTFNTTTYEYDTLGHLVKVTDAVGNETEMHYDGLGRKDWMNDPDMGEWHYGYDLAGNLKYQVDAKRQATHFYYDALHRLVGKTYELDVQDPETYGCPVDPGTGNYAIEHTYDCGGDCPASNYGKGRLTRMDDLSGWTEWSYDKRGRVEIESKTIDTQTFETEYAYDAADRVRSMEYPDDEVLTYGYSDRGLLESLTGQGGTYSYVTGVSHNEMGQITSMGYGNGTITDYVYDPLNYRLESVQVSNMAETLLDLAYTYDNVGNVLTITDAENGGQVQHFDYDSLDRLASAWTTGDGEGAYDRTYVYDPIGNILSKSDMGDYTYGDPAHVHAVTRVDRTETELPEGAVFHAPFDGDADDVIGSAQATTSGGAIYPDGQISEGVQVAEGTENLITNPSFELDTTGWTRGGSNTLVHSDEQAWFGTGSAKCTYQNNANLALYPITLAPAEHVASVWVYIPGDYDGADIQIQFNDFAGGNGPGAVSADMAKVDQWQRVSSTPVTLDAGDLSGVISVRAMGAAPTAGRQIYIDGVQVEENAYTTPYADGSLGDGHAWSGAAHNSTSSRTAASLSYDASIVDLEEGSLSLWYYEPGQVTGTWRRAVDISIDDDNFFRVILSSSTAPTPYAVSKSGGVKAKTNAGASTATVGWHHVAVTWESGSLRLYLDGVQSGSVGNYVAPVGTPSTVYVGTKLGSSNHADTVIDDLVSFDRVLTPEEVTQLHSQGLENTYTYDANGNQTQRVVDGVTFVLTYTAENKVSMVENLDTGETTTFTYDGNGARVKKDVDGTTTYYVGGIYEVQGSTETKYYYAGTKRVAMRVNDTISETIIYMHGDHLGSTSLTTDQAGAVVARVLYYPYGEERHTEGTLQTDYGYTGQRNEAGFGLMDYNARYYDPALGRFVSADTVVPDPANPQSLNRFAYVLNNP